MEPIIVKASQKTTASLIFLHGLGDTGHGWSDVGHALKSSLPHFNFIFPHAKTKPVTINGGMRMPAWYDIRDLGQVTEKIDWDGLTESKNYVEELVQKEIDSGIPANRIVIGGFSQGGAVTLMTLIRSQIKFGAGLVLSSYLPGLALNDFTKQNQDIPIFQAHGTSDQVIPFFVGQKSNQIITTGFSNVSFKQYYMEHSFCPEEMNDLKSFLQTHFPQ